MGGPGLGEEGEAGGLRGLALDWPFLRSTKGALLGAELALCFLVFLLLTVSVSAYMAAPLLEGLLAAGAVGLRLVRCQERAPRVHWSCLDFLRSASAALVFLVVSPAAIAASREGPSVCAFTFGLILIALFAYDACSTYWSELRPEPAPGDPPGPPASDPLLLQGPRNSPLGAQRGACPARAPRAPAPPALPCPPRPAVPPTTPRPALTPTAPVPQLSCAPHSHPPGLPCPSPASSSASAPHSCPVVPAPQPCCASHSPCPPGLPVPLTPAP